MKISKQILSFTLSSLLSLSLVTPTFAFCITSNPTENEIKYNNGYEPVIKETKKGGFLFIGGEKVRELTWKDSGSPSSRAEYYNSKHGSTVKVAKEFKKNDYDTELVGVHTNGYETVSASLYSHMKNKHKNDSSNKEKTSSTGGYNPYKSTTEAINTSGALRSDNASNKKHSNGHKHKYSWKTVVGATCTKDGKQEYKCSCGKTAKESSSKKSSRKIKAKGHNYVSQKTYKKSMGKDDKRNFNNRLKAKAEKVSLRNKEHNNNLEIHSELHSEFASVNDSTGYGFSTEKKEVQLKTKPNKKRTNKKLLIKDALVCKRCGRIKMK